jgi:hypothetical protein
VINYRKLREIKFQFLPSGILRSNVIPQDKAIQCRNGLTTLDLLKVAMVRTAKHAISIRTAHAEGMRNESETSMLHAVLRETS